MLKPVIQIYPVLPTKDEAERATLRPIGRNRELYQETLQGWHDIVRAADELGVWGAATIEHHFWSEGYEVGPNPGILDAYWAAITKNIRLGQLGYVMSTQNPIRVAEETAILDHLTQGRTFVGFARGYQSRWTNVLGQHYGARATRSPSAAMYNNAATGFGVATATAKEKDLSDDGRNREIFEESVDILLKAWTQESFSHQGMNWSIPFPHETGVDDWQLAQHGITQRLGAPREVGPDGSVREICVTPAPYTKPYPPVFVSGSGSPETIEYCARKGFIPVYFTNINTAAPLSHRYLDIARRAGFDWRAGQNQCLVRWMQVGKTEDAARARDEVRLGYLQELLRRHGPAQAQSRGRVRIDPRLGPLRRRYRGVGARTIDRAVEAVPGGVHRPHLPLRADAQGRGDREPRSVHAPHQAGARRGDRHVAASGGVTLPDRRVG
ncbi:MAG: LLM class flavin-dependent oxidoreductase [Xanthobacteraceae bacterium]